MIHSTVDIEQKGNFNNSVRNSKMMNISMDTFQLSPDAWNVFSMSTLSTLLVGSLCLLPTSYKHLNVSMPVDIPEDGGDENDGLCL